MRTKNCETLSGFLFNQLYSLCSLHYMLFCKQVCRVYTFLIDMGWYTWLQMATGHVIRILDINHNQRVYSIMFRHCMPAINIYL